MTRAPALIAAAAVLLPTLLFAADAIERPLTFATEGGDAWTFVKPITVDAAADACDAVWIGSPKGMVTARREGRRFVAGVPLTRGDNEVRAQCINNGWARGAPAVQYWNVRLTGLPPSEPAT